MSARYEGTDLGDHVQFVLLASTWWLNEHGRRPTQVELAARAGTDVKMTSTPSSSATSTRCPC
jgi:hypothetical protein